MIILSLGSNTYIAIPGDRWIESHPLSRWRNYMERRMGLWMSTRQPLQGCEIWTFHHVHLSISPATVAMWIGSVSALLLLVTKVIKDG